MEAVEELTAEPQHGEALGIQAGGWLLELSPDWIVVRASENIHHLLHQSHVALIDEPLGRFVHAQALHDLRNLFSRLSGTLGIARAYGVRLSDDPDLVDIAFQLSDGRVILEAVPAAGSFGESFGSVGGLIEGLAGHSGQRLLDNAARRMRALTGYDRVRLTFGDMLAESSRGSLAPVKALELPPLIADAQSRSVPVFPRRPRDEAIEAALLRAPAAEQREELRECGVGAVMRVPFASGSGRGEFRCDSRTPREPSFELHAAAELFAQLFGMRLEIERLKGG